jgi:AcrR family transcriptional regulator
VLRDGYPGMTFEGIAKLAGVAPQTVRPIFGSKPKILAAILERAAYGVGYQDLVQVALHSPTPRDHLRSAARIARTSTKRSARS